MNKITIGIDASNIGGGGGVTHLHEILKNFDYNFFETEIKSIVVFGSFKTLSHIEDNQFIKKVSFPNLNKTLLHRVWFQLFQYDKEVSCSCDILFSLTGDYIGNFKPIVSMSRNMLLYERDIWYKIRKVKEILRFWLNFKKQKRCFKNSNGIIFISNYAKDYINSVLKLDNKEMKIIHHGISPRFINNVKKQYLTQNYSIENTFKFLYVSTVHIYKHQWNIIKAIAFLREKGYPVELHLVGGIIFKEAGIKLYNALNKYDPDNKYIFYHGDQPYDKIDSQYKLADGVIFASTCENMPNILIEAMASGTPIACSEKMPMPEFLGESGYYFNSENVDSIVAALEIFLQNPTQREIFANRNISKAQNYSWYSTSKKTFEFVINIYKNY